MAAASRQTIAFGPFEFDGGSGLLYRGEQEILLPMRVGKVLEILLRRPGEVLTKEELLGEVWKDAFVGEDSLTQAISMVRSALEDDPRDPTYIQTIPKRGYRFIGEVGVAGRSLPAKEPAAAGQEGEIPQEGESGGVIPFPEAPEMPGVTAGGSLGQYEILAELGAGAMGVVYRARDTVLEREVAIKVLPEDFVSDPDRVARFEREAKLLAAVSHPNIAAIHSLEEEGGAKFPVLELVEGETLEERLRSGPIKVEDALELARQLASGLEAAHERGIIHRDLKPANIKITPAGQVKVLDFGLAKALEVKVFGEGVSESPTESMTIMGSRRGSIVGTAAYMSPEQARGQEAGRQADIWAFGCVLYEMLTGKRAFAGDTVSDTIAGLLKQEPAWDALPDKTPQAARRVLHRCLTKDPRDRLHDIADARIELEAALAPDSTTYPGSKEQQEEPPLWNRALPWGVATAALMVAVGAVLWSATGRQPSTVGPHRYSIDVSGDPRLAPAWRGGAPLAISPDGSIIVYRGVAAVAGSEGPSRLYLHRFETGEATVLNHTEGASHPFFSPDSQWIGFFKGGRLMKLSVTGGAPTDVCDLPGGSGGQATWTARGTIIFVSRGSLMRVPADGGSAEPLAAPRLDEGEVVYGSPHALPGGRAIVYTVITSEVYSVDDAKIAVLDIETDERQVLFEGGNAPVYSPTGHLVYLHADTLRAVAFDVDTYMTQGMSFEVETGLEGSLGGARTFSLAGNGTLAYVPGVPFPYEHRVVWVDQESRVEPIADRTFRRGGLEISPDGSIVAIDTGGYNSDIDIYEFARGLILSLEREWGQHFGTWMPNGERFIFRERIGDASTVYSFDMNERELELLPIDLGEYTNPYPASTSPNAEWLAIHADHPSTGSDLLLVPLHGEPVPQVLLATDANESWPRFSPDGRFIAYLSDESGDLEVYVKAASERGVRGRRIPATNSHSFRWGADSGLLYYFDLPSDRFIPDFVMAVPIGPEVEPIFGEPFRAFELDDRFWWWSWGHWDVDNQGRMLAYIADDSGPPPTRIIVDTNWFEELKRMVPVER